MLTEQEHLNETLINRNDGLEVIVRAMEAESAHERARAIGIEQDLKTKRDEANLRETEGLRAELRSAEGGRSLLESRLRESVERVAALERELADGGRTVEGLRGERERLGSEHEILRETSGELKKKLEGEIEERSRLRAEVGVLGSEIESLRGERERLGGERDILKETSGDLKKKLEGEIEEGGRLRAENGALSGQVESLKLEQSRLVNELSFKSSQLEKLRGEVRAGGEKGVELEKNVSILGGEVNGLKEEVLGKDNFINEMAITHKAVLVKLRVAQEKLGRENVGLMGKVERLMGKVEGLEPVVSERDELKGICRRLEEEVEELGTRLAEEGGRVKGLDREREKKAEDVRRLDGELRKWEKEKEEWGWEKERMGVAELEGECRKWGQERLELEHLNRTLKVKGDGLSVKVEGVVRERGEEKRAREEVEERERLLVVEKEDLEKMVREGEVKLGKEVELKRAGQRREKNLKVDCEALSNEMVEMNGRIEEEEKRAREEGERVSKLKVEVEEAKVLLRKKTEWQRLHEERLQEEEVEHRGKVVDLEHKLRMSHGELKARTLLIERSKGGG
ncbi:hypothetical protein TL16_g00656 [Triparma laevis f. inornata]|uniref:Uncharacterized protein n=1 Tax=Triparma laevis f. inornata TaxID=1714386 RepID=A0A9W6ZH41_9STRA|nr:hypothetical protein TL16_g00656 [Triparma laevis f. inornata]